MKRIIFGLMLAMMFCTLVQGANRTVTENDGQGNKKRVIELRDTVINGETVTDTLSIMTYENGTGSSDAPEKWRTHHSSMDWINPEKPDVPLNKNDAFQKVQKRRVQEKR